MTVKPPNFLYINIPGDCIPIGINGYEDRDLLLRLAKAPNN